MVHTFNPSTLEAEASLSSSPTRGQPGLLRRESEVQASSATEFVTSLSYMSPYLKNQTQIKTKPNRETATWEAEIGSWVPDQPGQFRETLPQT